MHQTANSYETPYNPRLDKGSEMLLAIQLHQPGLYNALGGSLHVFFWLYEGRQAHGSVRFWLRSVVPFSSWQCTHRQLNFPNLSGSQHEGIEDGPLQARHTNPPGRTYSKLCPVMAILTYMVRKGNSDGPFFRFEDGRHLTRVRFVITVHRALITSSINPSHCARYSFRLGAATTAANCGLQDSLIKTLGRWESSAYTLYIRTPKETLCSVSRSLAGTCTR